MEIIDNRLHVERATNAFNQSFDSLLRQIEQQIKGATQQGEFSCRVYFDVKLPQSVVKDIKIMLKGANYDIETGCCDDPLKGILNFLEISWATNEGKIKKDIMIIREYEYDEKRPWNCQERFLEFRGYENPWQEYKDRLFGKLPSTLSMNDRILIDTIHEDEKENALSFEFGIRGYTYVHVAQEWTEQFDREPIVEKIGKGEEYDKS